MAESATKAHQRVQLLGHLLWGLVDLSTLKPCREPVETNHGSAFVLESALQALLPLSKKQLPTGFLAIAGECRFLRTQFPDNLLTIVSEQVGLLIQTLRVSPVGSTASNRGDQYRIVLAIHPSRVKAREWIEAQNHVTQKDPPTPSPGQMSPAKRVALALQDLPADYEGRYQALKTFQNEIRTEVAVLLQPVLQEQAAAMPIDTYAEKQHVSTWVNSQLRELGLAIRCPHTGRPAILVADLRDAETQSSRFRYAIRDERGRQTKTVSSKQLPDLELMADDPRQESRAKGPAAGRVPQDD